MAEQDNEKGKTSNLQAALAVFWSFLGVRKGRDYAKDAQQLKPAQVIIAGIIGAALFIATLIFVVSLVLK
jgi:hypothetical protein